MSLVLKNVSKSFAGKKAVDNISFSLTKPGVYGLLGTNGAGKTTTIRMLLGIIKKDSGEITWKGKPVDRKSVRFGYLPEERGVYPKTKIFDQLMYFAELKGMQKDEAISSINKWAKVLKVEEYLQMPAEKLSKGNQQKIQFMTAIIHDPELVVLDEPFSGLDPVNTEILKNIIINLIKNGKYIIMSAHQMATIEEFCSDILILNKGKTVLQGNLKEIKEKYPANRVEIDVKQDIKKYIEELNLEIETETNNNYIIKISDEMIEEMRKTLPEMPESRRARYIEEYKLPEYDADILTGNKHLADLFEATTAICNNPKKVSNWLMVETMRLMKENEMEPEQLKFSPENLAKLINLAESRVINSSVAKEVFEKIFNEDIDPEKYVEENGLKNDTDDGALKETIEKIVADNPQSVEDYHSGKKKAIGFLVGQTMKATQGKADPGMINQILKEILDK